VLALLTLSLSATPQALAAPGEVPDAAKLTLEDEVEVVEPVEELINLDELARADLDRFEERFRACYQDARCEPFALQPALSESAPYLEDMIHLARERTHSAGMGEYCPAFWPLLTQADEAAYPYARAALGGCLASQGMGGWGLGAWAQAIEALGAESDPLARQVRGELIAARAERCFFVASPTPSCALVAPQWPGQLYTALRDSYPDSPRALGYQLAAMDYGPSKAWWSFWSYTDPAARASEANRLWADYAPGSEWSQQTTGAAEAFDAAVLPRLREQHIAMHVDVAGLETEGYTRYRDYVINRAPDHAEAMFYWLGRVYREAGEDQAAAFAYLAATVESYEPFFSARYTAHAVDQARGASSSALGEQALVMALEFYLGLGEDALLRGGEDRAEHTVELARLLYSQRRFAEAADLLWPLLDTTAEPALHGDVRRRAAALFRKAQRRAK
jgi:hypothetical protein